MADSGDYFQFPKSQTSDQSQMPMQESPKRYLKHRQDQAMDKHREAISNYDTNNDYSLQVQLQQSLAARNNQFPPFGHRYCQVSGVAGNRRLRTSGLSLGGDSLHLF